METALLLCILGTVLAVFIPTFIRRVRTNKISEASELLQEMSERAAAYYATSWDSGLRHCLPPAAGPTPAAPGVEPVTVDFVAADQPGHESWSALDFQPDRPIRYSYSYRPAKNGCDLESSEGAALVSFRAEGDLDGDGVRSTFERRATLEAGALEPEGVLHVHQRIE
jgi:type II secretory pathway pseudopilin PulG